MEDDADLTSILALLLSESEHDQPSTSEQTIFLLRHQSPEIRLSAWCGLRLASPRHVEPHLRALLVKPKWDFASAAALDILAFHRLPVQAEFVEPPAQEDDKIAWLLVEAGGRMRGDWKATHLKQFLGHASPRVRAAALRASARSSLPNLHALCRERSFAAQEPDLECLRFLGVVGEPADVKNLLTIAKKDELRLAAFEAIGRLGFVDSIPILIEALSDPALIEPAAAAFQRITGEPVRRGDPLPPPADATEEQLDFDDPIVPVDIKATKAWWSSESHRFPRGERFRAGHCVSENPLGTVYDHLPGDARLDVYLRERALKGQGVPDMEPETWWYRQRNPGGPWKPYNAEEDASLVPLPPRRM